MSNVYKIVIAVLVLVAVVLGLKIYGQKNPVATPQTTTQTNSSAQTSTKSQLPALTADQEKLFNPPASNATAAEKRAHYDLALKMSTEGDSLQIKNCVANPEVLRVRLNSTFSVKNAGTKEITFGFDKKSNIAPGATATIKADFKNGVGIYGYGCTDTQLNRQIGYIMVMPAK